MKRKQKEYDEKYDYMCEVDRKGDKGKMISIVGCI